MPARAAVPQVLQVTMTFDVGSDTNVINRFYLHYSGSAPTDVELETMGDAIANNWNSHLASFMFSTGSLFSTEIVDLTSDTAAVGFSNTGFAGTNTGEPLPAGACAIVKYEIARRYRGGHPKQYGYYGVAESLDSIQQWLPAFRSGLLAAWEAFIAEVLTDGWSGAGTIAHVAVSFFFGFTNHLYPSGRYRAIPTARPTPLVDSVIGYDVNPNVGSQRRRNKQST